MLVQGVGLCQVCVKDPLLNLLFCQVFQQQLEGLQLYVGVTSNRRERDHIVYFDIRMTAACYLH